MLFDFVYLNMQDASRIAGMTGHQNRNITSIINEYSKRLLGFIRKRVNNEQDAEDILQEVFYQFAGNTEPIEQATGWLFRVTRNKITDLYRKKKMTSLEMLAEDYDEDTHEWVRLLTEKSANPEKQYLQSFFWEALQDALEELPTEQRDVFVQHEIEGITFKQIAEQTGTTVNTLLSRKRYAILHLRERLKGLRDELLDY